MPVKFNMAALLVLVSGCSVSTSLAGQERIAELNRILGMRSEVATDTERELQLLYVRHARAYPQFLLRIIEGQDKALQPTAFLYWWLPGEDSHKPTKMYYSSVREGVRRWCAEPIWGDAYVVCEVAISPAPKWDSILEELEDHDVWDLPDEATLEPPPAAVWDGWGLQAAVLTSSGYRSYRYWVPDRRPWPEAKQALAITRVLDELQQNVSRLSARRGP